MSMITVHGVQTMYDNDTNEADTVTAGTPGTWGTGLHAADLTELRAEIFPSPRTAWTGQQYVVLLDASEAYWDGTTWQVGRAPELGPITNVTAGIPGAFVPAGPYASGVLFANITALRASTTVGTTGSATVGTAAWTVGQYVVLDNAAHVYWTGSAWATGEAPA